MPSHKLILIDDDELVHQTWTYVANIKQHDLTCYFTVEDFLKHHHTFETPIYIDYALKGSTNGLEYIRYLKSLGYQHLYLATGYTKSSLNIEDETLAFTSKDYPF